MMRRGGTLALYCCLQLVIHLAHRHLRYANKAKGEISANMGKFGLRSHPNGLS